MRRYVALGSSFAAGPGLGRRVPGSPRPAWRSTRNYAHLLAERLDLDLVDVSYSGATAAEMLDGTPEGRPPQIEAVTADTDLVTVTGGGNDVGYLTRLTLASVPRPLGLLVRARSQVAEIGRRRDERMAALGRTFDRLTAEIRRRAPQAEIYLVDYLTILPPDDSWPTGRLPAGIARWGRETAARLADETRAAAERAGCGYVAASQASREHHAWAAEPWTRQFHYSLRGGAPYHPTARGMRAVAGLIEAARTGR